MEMTLRQYWQLKSQDEKAITSNQSPDCHDGCDCWNCRQWSEALEAYQERTKRIETWNLNLTIFDIYDEVREMDEDECEQLLTQAWHMFAMDDSKDSLENLAYHLGYTIDKEALKEEVAS